MTIKQQMARREFVNKLESLALSELSELYDKLKVDPEVSFETLGLISQVYNRKSQPISL